MKKIFIFLLVPFLFVGNANASFIFADLIDSASENISEKIISAEVINEHIQAYPTNRDVNKFAIKTEIDFLCAFFFRSDDLKTEFALRDFGGFLSKYIQSKSSFLLKNPTIADTLSNYSVYFASKLISKKFSDNILSSCNYRLLHSMMCKFDEKYPLLKESGESLYDVFLKEHVNSIQNTAVLGEVTLNNIFKNIFEQFDIEYSNLEEETRKTVLNLYTSVLHDVIWFIAIGPISKLCNYTFDKVKNCESILNLSQKIHSSIEQTKNKIFGSLPFLGNRNKLTA